MEAPPSACGSTCPVVLEHVWDALLLTTRSWTRIPGWSWAVPLGTVLLLFLRRRRLPPRRAKAPGQRCSARARVCAAGRQDTGPTTQAQDGRGPAGALASPPSLQTLCLAAMSHQLSRLVLPGPADGLKKDQRSPSRAGPGLQAGPPPDLPAGDAGAGTRGVPPKSGARNGDHTSRRAALEPQAVTEDTGFPVSPPGPEAGPQDRATRLEAERREIAELARHIHRLHTREAALQRERARLDRDIQQLRRSLQKPLDEQDELALRLHGALFRGAAQREALQSQLAGLRGDLELTCHLRNLHQEMARDVRRELPRHRSHRRELVLVQHNRAARAREAAVSSERKFWELRGEHECLRRTLALPAPALPACPSCSCRSARSPRSWGRVTGSLGSSGPRGVGRSPREGSGIRGRLRVGPGSGPLGAQLPQPGSASAGRAGKDGRGSLSRPAPGSPLGPGDAQPCNMLTLPPHVRTDLRAYCPRSGLSPSDPLRRCTVGSCWR